jgi:hypothetical protein
MTKFDRAFVQNPNFRFSAPAIKSIANEIVFVCDVPMFDDLMGAENRKRFEGEVAEKLRTFDPARDVVVFFGDPIIFAMIIQYLTIFVLDDNEAIKIARWSAKKNEYVIREISETFYAEEQEA